MFFLNLDLKLIYLEQQIIFVLLLLIIDRKACIKIISYFNGLIVLKWFKSENYTNDLIFLTPNDQFRIRIWLLMIWINLKSLISFLWKKVSLKMNHLSRNLSWIKWDWRHGLHNVHKLENIKWKDAFNKCHIIKYK